MFLRGLLFRSAKQLQGDTRVTDDDIVSEFIRIRGRNQILLSVKRILFEKAGRDFLPFCWILRIFNHHIVGIFHYIGIFFNQHAAAFLESLSVNCNCRMN